MCKCKLLSTTVADRTGFVFCNDGRALPLAEALYLQIMEQRDEIENRLATDLNKRDNTHNEHISEVFIEMEPVGNNNWREQTGVYRPRTIAPANGWRHGGQQMVHK